MICTRVIDEGLDRFRAYGTNLQVHPQLGPICIAWCQSSGVSWGDEDIRAHKSGHLKEELIRFLAWAACQLSWWEQVLRKWRDRRVGTPKVLKLSELQCKKGTRMNLPRDRFRSDLCGILVEIGVGYERNRHESKATRGKRFPRLLHNSMLSRTVFNPTGKL